MRPALDGSHAARRAALSSRAVEKLSIVAVVDAVAVAWSAGACLSKMRGNEKVDIGWTGPVGVTATGGRHDRMSAHDVTRAGPCRGDGDRWGQATET
jgi:hypothetical protein